jgi:DNA-binding transcriptional ArsR family regulator/protein-L-isoaspartate O-methyltransferase
MMVYTHPVMMTVSQGSGDRPGAGARWELYRCLGEPARLRLMALAAEEELAVGELAELLGESQPNVSRHLGPLRQAGVVSVRRQGNWTLVRLAEGATGDAVLCDALSTGRSLCERDGSLGRVAEVVRARDRGTREFFARAGRTGAQPGPPTELAAYLFALRGLVAQRALAVDAGTGDGRLLEVLAPLFSHVVAVDRSGAQLAAAAERVAQRGFGNVDLVEGALDDAAVRKAVRRRAKEGADLVLAARVLHHAPKPAEVVRQLVGLGRPGAMVVVLDYARHEDEALRAHQADLWLGFEPDELAGLLRDAGVADVAVTPVPAAWCGHGPDRHLPWLIAAGTTPAATGRNDTDTPNAPVASRRQANAPRGSRS